MAANVESAKVNSKKIKWTFVQEQALIELVRNQRHLWDVKHHLYVNRYLKRTSYQDISDTLAEQFPESAELFNTDEVMTKFGNLRTVFQCQNKIYMNQPSGSAGLGFVPRYKHFFAMQFLADTVKATPSTSNLNSDEGASEKDNEDTEAPVEDDSMILDSASEVVIPETPDEKTPNRKRKRKPSNEMKELAYKTLKDLQDKEELYGQYIASVLKSFDPITRDLCKCEFQNIIFKLRHANR